jgi:hypothetical protein
MLSHSFASGLTTALFSSPQRVLDGLVQRELSEGKVILPVWHKVTHAEILRYSAALADKIAVSYTITISQPQAVYNQLQS